MAGESGQSRRSRPVTGVSGDSDPTLTNVDPSMAPITANTPLPPVMPLPLASQSGSESAAPPPPAAGWSDASEQPVPPLPPPGSALPQPNRPAGAGVSSTWAAYTTFALMFTSLILVVVMAIAAAEISKKADVLIWIIVLTFVINIVYAVVIFNMARPGQPMRLPFMTPRRGP